MIQHLNQVSKAVAALELLSRKNISTLVQNNRIVVKIPSVKIIEFETEEEYMVWLLNEIIDTAKAEITWFEEHPAYLRKKE
jgi:hypothetical protein